MTISIENKRIISEWKMIRLFCMDTDGNISAPCVNIFAINAVGRWRDARCQMIHNTGVDVVAAEIALAVIYAVAARGGV